MTYQEAEKIYLNVKYEYTKNALYKGLTIMAKYCDYMVPVTEHEEMWIHPKYNDGVDGVFNEMLSRMSEEDVRLLFKMGWRIDDDVYTWHLNT